MVRTLVRRPRPNLENDFISNLYLLKQSGRLQVYIPQFPFGLSIAIVGLEIDDNPLSHSS